MSIKDTLTATVGGTFTTALVVIFYGVWAAMTWWSIRVTIWFFTGGDFPVPWQPFG